MADILDRVLEEALRLSQDQRVRLVTELLATLEPDVPSEQRTETEWIAELERRARAAIAGSPGTSWAEAKGQIQRRFPRQ